MPLVHVYLKEGKSDQDIQKIGDGIHKAFMEAWGIPKHDRFHIFHEKKLKHLMIDKEMWDVKRSDDVIVIHIFTSPRTKEMKLNFYKCLHLKLKEIAGIRGEDIFVRITNNNYEDWSFGEGKAHLI